MKNICDWNNCKNLGEYKAPKEKDNSKKFRMSAICRYHNMASKDFEPGLNIYRYSNKKINKKVHGF